MTENLMLSIKVDNYCIYRLYLQVVIFVCCAVTSNLLECLKVLLPIVQNEIKYSVSLVK